MFSPEQYYFNKVLGIRKEFPEINPVAAGLLIARSRLHVETHRSKIEGVPLPKSSSALVVGNHNTKGDSYKICIAGVNAGRLIRPIVKKGLIEEGFSESREYLLGINAEEDSLGYNYLDAFVLRGVASIAVDRENTDVRRFIKETDAVITTGGILGLYFQPHRYEDAILRNLQVGAAVIAKRHPDLPVYLCALSSPPHSEDRLHIFEPITYNQKVSELGRKIGSGELTIIFADTIIQGLPETSQRDWETRREIELARLTTPYRRPAA